MLSRILALTAFVFFSCDPKDSLQEKANDADNIVRQEWPDGTLKMEIPTKNKKKHGIAKTYYRNGKLRQEIEYKEGTKEGKAVNYYESGKPYRVSFYRNNMLEGTRTLYRENGNLLAEIPYTRNEPCKGTKEYLLDGSIKKKYPRIVFREINEIFARELVTLEVSLSEKAKNIEFYRGELDSGGCISRESARMVIPQKEGVLKIFFPVAKGTFIMQELKMVVKFTTTMGNPYYLESSYNLAVENR